MPRNGGKVRLQAHYEIKPSQYATLWASEIAKFLFKKATNCPFTCMNIDEKVVTGKRTMMIFGTTIARHLQMREAHLTVRTCGEESSRSHKCVAGLRWWYR
jgi:hypothetical protein